MSKKKPLSPEQLAECEAAHRLFLAKKNELKLSQKKVADAAGISPPAVNLYFKGVNPLNAKFASILAGLLGEPVESFSPRLARELEGLTGVVSGYQNAKKYQRASPEHRQAVDELADRLLDLSPADALKVRQAMELLMPTNDSRQD